MNTRTEATEQNKATLVKLMKEWGIHQIAVEFDGCGDSGQIENVTALDENGKEIENDSLDERCEIVHTSQTYKEGEWIYEKFTRTESLQDLAETVAYTPLEDHFGGWEINEGSYGTIVINADGTGTIDYNQRVVDIETDSASF
jgi:hypothetical protein